MVREHGFDKLILRPRGGVGLGPDVRGMSKFEQTVKLAKEAGFTHIDISVLSERTDFRGEDKDSPWCEWSVNGSSIFKRVLPEGLEDAFPEDFVQRQMALMKARHDVVAKYGLKCAFWGNEPHWLSERVYAKHPDWRGARCDNSLRTVGMFFAPCVDNPEVLELYRQAVKGIVTQCPLLDTFAFKANDAGSGYCWSSMLYVNPNGNANCSSRPIGDRVMGLMRAIRQGAADGGVSDPDVRLNLHYFTEIEREAVASRLESDEKLALPTLANWGSSWEMIDATNPVPMAASFFAARRAGHKDLLVICDDPRWFTAFNLFKESTGVGSERDRIAFLSEVAGALYGSEVVDEVVDAWYRIADGVRLFRFPPLGQSHVVGTVGLRWLVRPLVAHPERLGDDEESYWLPYIYQSQASQPEAYKDYWATTGAPRMTTWQVATALSVSIDQVVTILDSAAALFVKAREKATDEAIKEALRIEELRVRARRCMMLTVRHVAQVAALIYERDRIERIGATDPENPDDDKGSSGLFYLHRALRWELDNTNDLISILKDSPVPIIPTTADKSQEGAFLYGPDLLENLEKKVQIMLRHWREAEDGYYRPTLGG